MMRTLAFTPSFSSAVLKGSTMRSKSGCTSRNSALSSDPWAFVSTPFLGVQPASANSFAAWLRCLRASSGPRLAGLLATAW